MRACRRSTNIDRRQRKQRPLARHGTQLAEFMRITAQGMFGQLARMLERGEIVGNKRGAGVRHRGFAQWASKRLNAALAREPICERKSVPMPSWNRRTS